MKKLIVILIFPCLTSPTFGMFKELSTDLKSAVIWGNFSAIKKFVEEQGVDINQQDEEGKTALHYTCTGRTYSWLEIDTITYLLEHGASPFIRDHSGRLPVDYLKSDGLKSSDLPALSSDLKSAVIWQNFSAIKKFVEEQGVNINQQDEEGKTALHYAYKTSTVFPDESKSNADIIAYLIKHGGDASVRDYSGRLPADYLTGRLIEKNLTIEENPQHWLRFDKHEETKKMAKTTQKLESDESQNQQKPSSIKSRITQWINKKCEKYFF